MQRGGPLCGPSGAPSEIRERGATLVEAAIVFPLLFLVIFAILEFGLAFKDDLSVGHAAREGARAGATFGNDAYANILVLEEVAGTLGTVSIGDGTITRIYNPVTGVGDNYRYEPGYGGGCDWFPCPDPDSLVYSPPVWSDRDVSAPRTDRIAVRVQFTHKWITGFFADTTDFTHDVDFQIEPQIFDP